MTTCGCLSSRQLTCPTEVVGLSLSWGRSETMYRCLACGRTWTVKNTYQTSKFVGGLTDASCAW